MKLPSIFKTASHQRFAIKPRYYDPIKEEIEERTSRIKKELEQEGLIEAEEDGSTTGRPPRSATHRVSPTIKRLVGYGSCLQCLLRE